MLEEEELREMEKILGRAVMNDDLKKVALREICCGRIKEWVDLKEEALTYAKLREGVMRYAMKKRTDGKRLSCIDWMFLHLVSALNQLQVRKFFYLLLEQHYH